MGKLIEEFHIRLGENYNTYVKEILEKSKKEIIDLAYQVYFYENLYDYLSQYEWHNSIEHSNRLNLLCHIQNLLGSIWNVYIETEWLGHSSWEEIDDLMGEFYRQNNIT